ncbi:hemerythrin family protein [Pinisolibacter sp. MA2-2]|nr:hemerythrin family protein [Pinisolibacter aquiterrae]MCC8233668.1 hemerythrin family protein [Pinisolibacter aquiterrae]
MPCAGWETGYRPGGTCRSGRSFHRQGEERLEAIATFRTIARLGPPASRLQGARAPPLSRREHDMTDRLLQDLVLGLAEIDDDHAASIALWTAARDSGPADFLAALTAWVDHLETHFVREEMLMKRIAYKEIAHHEAEHRRVVAEGRGFVAQVAAGRTMMARAYAAEMIPDWLRRHVVMFDSEVARVAKLAGVA